MIQYKTTYTVENTIIGKLQTYTIKHGRKIKATISRLNNNAWKASIIPMSICWDKIPSAKEAAEILQKVFTNINRELTIISLV